MAWVVGLIIPIWLAWLSVNQRLPSGPAVMSVGNCTGGGNGKLGDARRTAGNDLPALRAGAVPGPGRPAAAGGGASRLLAACRRKARRCPRAVVPGCVFDGVMRKLLSGVGVETRIKKRQHRSCGPAVAREWVAYLAARNLPVAYGRAKTSSGKSITLAGPRPQARSSRRTCQTVCA